MACRPVFSGNEKPPFYSEENVEFAFCPGFSLQQQRRSIENLQASYLTTRGDARILEISTRSENPLGVMLSAFNLILTTREYGRKPVEQYFQGGKMFEGGVSAKKALDMPPGEAKKYISEFRGQALSCFLLSGEKFPLEPKTFYYDWLYLNALRQNLTLSQELMNYDAFTDIAFNPLRSINCQARSAAIFMSLVKCGLLEDAMKSPHNFKETVYEMKTPIEQTVDEVQMSLFA